MGRSKKLWEKLRLEEFNEKCAWDWSQAQKTKDSERSKNEDCEDNKKLKENGKEG